MSTYAAHAWVRFPAGFGSTTRQRQQSKSSGNDVLFSSVQKAIDAAHEFGGGMVQVGPGVVDEEVTIYSHIRLDGSGEGATIWKLADGSNGALIKTEGFDDLTGTNTDDGPVQFSISNMTLQGNSDNNPLGGYGFRLYASDFRLYNLFIEDFIDSDIYSEFSNGASGTGSTSAYVNNVKCTRAGGHGVEWLGPHDSNFDKLMTSLNGAAGVYLHTNATGCQFDNCHSWGASQAYAFRLASTGIIVDNTQAESCQTANILIEANNVTISDSFVYNNSGSVANPVGVEIAETASASTIDGTKIHNCTAGAIKWAGTNTGHHLHFARIFQTEGPVVVGQPPVGAETYYKVSGGATPPVNRMTALPVRNTLELYDDFVTGMFTNGQIGQLGWRLNSVGSGSFVASQLGHPGIMRRTTLGVTGNYATMRAGDSINGGFHAGDNFNWTWIIRVQSADTDTTLRVGVGNDSDDNPPAAGIYFEKLAADINWFVVTRSSSTETRTDTGVAVTALSYYRLRTRRVDASTVAFAIDGGTEIEHTTNIPNSSVSPFTAVGTAAASSKSLDHDRYDIVLTDLDR